MRRQAASRSRMALFIATTLFAIPLVANAQSIDVPIYLTTAPPEIDGVISPGEWDAAGPATLVSPDDPTRGLNPGDIDDDAYGGASDLSFSYRAMWAEPWTAYFLVEITDDIAMEDDPANIWERDQVELFFDGNDLEGTDELESFHWWEVNERSEPFGKFGVSRYGTFEGNAAQMSDSTLDLFTDDETAFLAAAAAASETGDQGNYFVEYAINLEPMSFIGTFEDDPTTEDARQLVADHTVIKFQLAVSDDDNFISDDGSTERSHTLSLQDLSDWRATNEFPNLVFSGPFSGVPGDFDGDGDMDGDDIDALTAAIGSGDTKFDVTGDGTVDAADRLSWIQDLAGTWVGDSNLDGLFDSADFVQVFANGHYEDGVPGNSGWSDGDWNGDGEFDSSDFVAAFADGGYENGMRQMAAAVPEPSAVVLCAVGALLLVRRSRD